MAMDSSFIYQESIVEIKFDFNYQALSLPSANICQTFNYENVWEENW